MNGMNRLKPDFVSATGGVSADSRIYNAIFSLCGGLIPVDGPSGLRVAALYEIAMSEDAAAAEADGTEKGLTLRRLEDRFENAVSLLEGANARRVKAEAALEEALGGEDESKIPEARREVAATAVEIETLTREQSILDRLLREAETAARTERHMIIARHRSECHARAKARAVAAQRKLVDLMLAEEFSDALAEFALAVMVSSAHGNRSIEPLEAVSARYDNDRRPAAPAPGELSADVSSGHGAVSSRSEGLLVG